MDDIQVLDDKELIVHKTGRPMKFQSVELLQDSVKQYFLHCKVNERPLTITGLALWLDTTRETLCDYEKNPIFSDTIKKAKEMVANYVEEQCLLAKNPAGAIFLLKNHGFTDKQEIDHTVTSKVITVDMIGNIDD